MIQFKRLTDCPLIPWKNGGGMTQELFKVGNDPFSLRISVAKVASDGPFSSFPGLLRELILLEGSLILKFPNKKILLHSFQPFSFSGEDYVESHLLNGPVRDFNVIFSNEFKVKTEILEFKDEPFQMQSEQFLFISDGEVEYDKVSYSDTLFYGSGFVFPKLNSKGILVTAERRQ